MTFDRKNRLYIIGILFGALAVFGALTVFFDQAVLVRQDTIYHLAVKDKAVAITFDDGPSPVWTPQILDALKKAGVKATFFMLGTQALKYPEVARRVAAEGHEIGNHSYDHHGIFFYSVEEATREVTEGEKAIRQVTGVTTKYFRPPKAWINEEEKAAFARMGYKVVLWSLNSKDWVTFDDKYIVAFLAHNVRPGDIILFHDSGSVLGVEGGDRHETVLAVARLVEKLKAKGYRFLTVSELLKVSL
ncbi:MAG: polysaccharide deacetylase family protein [Candidatus Omnitrophota bacterium]